MYFCTKVEGAICCGSLADGLQSLATAQQFGVPKPDGVCGDVETLIKGGT